MILQSADFVAGAATASGVAIVIDVFRACSLAAHALAAGAERIIPIESIDEARALKALHPDWLLVGERHARRLSGFDCGNSPAELLAKPLTGRTLIHTTHAGTQGLVAASRHATHVFTGAFVNLSATIAAVRAVTSREVTVIAMGHEARERCLEDDLCREAIFAGLSRGADGPLFVAGSLLTQERLRERLRSAPAAAKFFDPTADWAPERDFELCTALDAVPFAVQVGRDTDGMLALRRGA